MNEDLIHSSFPSIGEEHKAHEGSQSEAPQKFAENELTDTPPRRNKLGNVIDETLVRLPTPGTDARDTKKTPKLGDVNRKAQQ